MRYIENILWSYVEDIATQILRCITIPISFMKCAVTQYHYDNCLESAIILYCRPMPPLLGNDFVFFTFIPSTQLMVAFYAELPCVVF